MTKQTKALVTPATITDVSFTEQLDDYKRAMDSEVTLSEEVDRLYNEIFDMIKRFGIAGGTTLSTTTLDEIVVYENPKEDKSVISKLAKEEGYHFGNIIGNTYVKKYLQKTFGKDFVQLFEDVRDAYDNKNTRDIDKVATAKARKDLQAKMELHESKSSQLRAVRKRTQNIERYISTVEKISNIAAKGK